LLATGYSFQRFLKQIRQLSRNLPRYARYPGESGKFGKKTLVRSDSRDQFISVYGTGLVTSPVLGQLVLRSLQQRSRMLSEVWLQVQNLVLDSKSVCSPLLSKSNSLTRQ
jgi:hypothetical protein